MKRYLVLLILVLPFAGKAADWVRLADSGWDFDVESVRETPAYVEVWARRFVDADDVKRRYHKKILYRIDCDNRSLGARSYASYSLDGRLVDSGSVHGFTMDPAVPETVGDSLVKLTCGLAKGEKWALGYVEYWRAAQAAANAAAAAASSQQ